MEESGDVIDLTELNDSVMMADAELAERLQMEELETLHQSDFEVAQHLQEMERQRAESHLIPELYMLGQSMRRSNSTYRAESRRCRPPRPPPPRPPQLPRTSSSEDCNADSGEPSTDGLSTDDATASCCHPGAAAASASSAAASRFSMSRRAQNAMNRNRRDPALPSAGTSTEPEHLQNTIDNGDAVAAAQSVTATRVARLLQAMNRNHSAYAMPPNIPVADVERSRAIASRTRGRHRWTPPVPAMPPDDDDVAESRDALNHNRLDPTAPVTPPPDAVGDAEQPDGVGAPPVPPRRQRRPPRNRRMQGPAAANLGLLQFSMRPIADYHETLDMPGWGHPGRRQHYQYSRMLDEDDGSGNNYDALWELSEQIGEVTNKGLDLIQITRLPTMKYKAPASTATSDDMPSDDAVSSSSSSESMSDATLAAMETVCRVCLCDFESDEVLRALPCCHRFHVHCIDQWIKQNAICPVCRDSIKDHLSANGFDQWNHFQ